MTEVFEFGAPAGQSVDDITFDDVELGRGGYPLAADEQPAAEQPAARPPQHPVPADEAGLPPGVRAGTDLAALLAEAHRDLGLLPVELPVPHRPGWTVRYRLLLDHRELQDWRRAAWDPETIEGVNVTTLAQEGLAALCVGLVRDGQPALDPAGKPVTFDDPQLQQALQASSAADACRAWYVLDAHLIATWSAVLRQSGQNDPIVPVEPPSPT